VGAGHSLRDEFWVDSLRNSGGLGGLNAQVSGVNLVLLPGGAVWWPSASTLWLSDLHLGKAAHFRKHGVPIGSEPTLATLHRLRENLKAFKPSRVLLLGDLFHSDINKEWSPFADLCLEHAHLDWVLVRGNHDDIPDALLQEAGIRQMDRLDDGPFTFTHDPADWLEGFGYHVCGHVHPGVRLSGSGRQRLRVRCFLFGQKQAVMPAYGAFTGIHVISPTKSDRVYAVTEEAVIEV